MKKRLSIIFVILAFIVSFLFFVPHEKACKINRVLSPVKFEFEKGEFTFSDLQSFDAEYSDKNKILAEKLGMTEEEAFIFGNLAKSWAENLMKGRQVYITEDDIIYMKYSYRTKLLYSGFCLVNGKPYYKDAFDKKLEGIRKANYKVYDFDSDKVYNPSDLKVRSLKNYIVLRKSHLPKRITNNMQSTLKVENIYDKGNIKIFFADLTNKVYPDRNCSSSICREILSNINSAHNTIDMAIYGYSRVPEIENALKKAINRGVKIRLVYDSDNKGENIYPDTAIITKLITNNKSDESSLEVKNIMHNKFYIFDDKTLITGSANLSHTDMSGFNSNSIVVINSSEAAKIYKAEFEQMYSGKFHSEKVTKAKTRLNISGSILEIYFSPQDKSIANAVLPIIDNAKTYIYIPTFVLTDKRVTAALIKAKNRGVDVKIIIDALNASVQHSKHNILRAGNIQVKTENYAGKMHSKSMIVDDKYTIIGSMNFSNSGENKNDENLVVITDSEIAKFYKEFFLYQWGKIDDKWLKYNARAEGKDSIGSCSDGLDNNYDGLTDNADLACK